MVWADTYRSCLRQGGVRCATALAAALALSGPADAQSRGIYTCVDAQGNRLTADRPIPACLDREQRVLNPSGTVQRHLPPEPTAVERAQQAERDRQAAQAREQKQKERQREQALVLRYPNQAVHDKEREATLHQIGERIQSAQVRLDDLAKQRTVAELELEFYKADPAKAPAALKRQLVDIDASTAAQKRFISDQEAERQQVQQRFDAERERLRTLWSREPVSAAPAAAPPAISSPNNPQP